MGRIFISVGHGGLKAAWGELNSENDAVIETQELGLARELIVQGLRSRGYDMVPVPNDISADQTIEWINQRARSGDIALGICANPPGQSAGRGAMVFYIAGNNQRKAQAEHLLQTYLRRVPQMPSRGAKPDTYTELGQLVFCRQTAIPALLMEVGSLTHPDDRRLIQAQRQEVAVGIAEGLALWSRSASSAPTEAAGKPVYPTVDITLNGANYDDKGILVLGNAYVPVDLIDQLSIEIPLHASIRRIGYRNIVFVRAIDLREFNISVNLQSEDGNRLLNLRSSLPFHASQFDRIMGKGQTSEVQMIMFLKSYNPEGLAQFPDLPKLYREEAEIEGVNYDLAFSQMCVETQFLHFPGSSTLEQNNFAHLGTGNSLEAATFSSTRIGVRAQIQHLKAYASTEPFVQAIVDPRFPYIRRGIAPTISQLSGRWSTDSQYHIKILSVLRRLYESAGFL
ncbi:MAG: hypothetical protein Kow00121_01950 [Elainellaceae cyanobacterium]